jgi:hypothetical protein
MSLSKVPACFASPNHLGSKVAAPLYLFPKARLIYISVHSILNRRNSSFTWDLETCQQIVFQPSV